jgi:DNA-binding transcriptional MerR regulator
LIEARAGGGLRRRGVRQERHMSKKRYWIGEVAAKLGLSLRTIRYYEELGLLKPKGRTEGKFRLYTEAEVTRLQAIQTLKNLGYSLKEIAELLRATASSKTGHELVTRMLGDLRKQEDIARQQISWCRATLKSIDSASRLLENCLGCRRKPTKSNCLKCRVFPSEEDVPVIFKAAFV